MKVVNANGKYVSKVNNRNNNSKCETCSKSTTKTPEQPRLDGVILMFLFLTFNRLLSLIWCFYCWLWTSNCWRGSALQTQHVVITLINIVSTSARQNNIALMLFQIYFSRGTVCEDSLSLWFNFEEKAYFPSRKASNVYDNGFEWFWHWILLRE